LSIYKKGGYLIKNKYTIDTGYKLLEKSINNKLYKKDFIDITQYNNIINTIDNEIKRNNKSNYDFEEDKRITIKIKI